MSFYNLLSYGLSTWPYVTFCEMNYNCRHFQSGELGIRRFIEWQLNVFDYKYGGYYDILDAARNNSAEAISFDDAVMTAFIKIRMWVRTNLNWKDSQCSSHIVIVTVMQIITFLLMTKGSGFSQQTAVEARLESKS